VYDHLLESLLVEYPGWSLLLLLLVLPQAQLKLRGGHQGQMQL